MLNAFYALKGKYADKRKLGRCSDLLWNASCAEKLGGWQDQIAAAFGGLNQDQFQRK